ncbi:WxL domain-containing protein [Arthrobacter globiformis]|uniref:WxL domain-containing protein n=1 Tax=Arthrobacter globiformis TaxID=1665 RepID=UPI0027D7CAB5|nr:WxL domain-containing protein [Arthrobacter globiformis]
MEAHVSSPRQAPSLTATRKIQAALSLACSAALAAGSAAPASAAHTLTTVAVSSGSLGFSSAPASVTLGRVDPGSAAAIPLRGITVSDNRAGTLGWSATVVLTDFTGDTTGAALSSASAKYAPTAATTSGTATVTATTAINPTLPRIVQTATGVSGNNTATWNADLTLPVPNDAVRDTYTATLTYSVS